MKKYQIVLLLPTLAFLLSMTLSLFVWLESPKAEKTLLSTDSLKVVQEGNRIVISDALDDKEYNFIIRHKRHSEGRTTPITVSQDGANITVILNKKCIYLFDNIAEKKYVLRIGKIFPKVYKSTFNFMKKRG